MAKPESGTDAHDDMPGKRTLGRAEHELDRAKLRVKARLGLFRPLQVQVFRGHGSPRRLRVTGRVAEETSTHRIGAGTGGLRHALNTLRRMESDEMPNARLRVSAAGAETETRTDAEGFFAVELDFDSPLEAGWHSVRVTLLASPAGDAGVTGRGAVLVPPADCEFGVISDVDDTVVRTGARHRLTHTRILLFRDAMEQQAFPGIADFYHELQRGADGRGANPIFYVSRSAWGLYDLFVEALDGHGIPKGPIFLMDAAVIEEKSAAVGHVEHKLETMEEILAMHDGLSFVLVGDSGQHDPETYLEATRRWPDRIRAVYIRDVTTSATRDREVAELLRRIADAGIPALAAADTAAMARHARRIGLIGAAAG